MAEDTKRAASKQHSPAIGISLGFTPRPTPRHTALRSGSGAGTPRSASGAPPPSPTPRHMAMRSPQSSLSAAVRRYPTEVSLSPATVRSSRETAAKLPPGRSAGTTLPSRRTSSAAADFGHGLGLSAATRVAVPELVEMRRIVERRSVSTASTTGATSTTAADLDGNPFLSTGYVSPYRTASTGLVPSSTVTRSSSSYESPLSFVTPRTLRACDRLGEDLLKVPVGLAGTEVAEVVRNYKRTGGVLNSASSLEAADTSTNTSADELLERLQKEQWQRELKGEGARKTVSRAPLTSHVPTLSLGHPFRNVPFVPGLHVLASNLQTVAGRALGVISKRIEAEIGASAAMAASAGGDGGLAAPSRPLTLTEKLQKCKELRESAVRSVETAVTRSASREHPG